MQHGTVADLISHACWSSRDSHLDHQIQSPLLGCEESMTMVVCSSGVDAVGLLANLLLECLQRALKRYEAATKHPSAANGSLMSFKPLAFVLMPDAASDDEAHQLRESLQLAIAATIRRRSADVHPPPLIHAVVEGTPIKQRAAMYFDGGIVISGARFFCADVLHKRMDLFFTLCGAVVWFPSPGQSSCSARQIGKALSSLAFAAELMFARNDEIPAASPDSSAAPRWPQRAPLFVASDFLKAMHYCLSSRAVLDGPRTTFLEAFRVHDILLYPRFRLDIVKHMDRVLRRGRTGGDRDVNTTRSPSDFDLQFEFVSVSSGNAMTALHNILTKILEEVVAELASTERRLDLLSPPTLLQPGAPPRRGRASEAPHSWRDERRPCGIAFQHLNVKDLVGHAVDSDDAVSSSSSTEARIFLETVLRDELQRDRAAVAPYVPLLRCVDDLLYLMERLPFATPGSFLLLLEHVISGGARVGRFHGHASSRAEQQQTMPHAPLWTLSERFCDVMQVATNRVFLLEQPQVEIHRDAPAVCDVDADPDDDDVVEVAAVVPPQKATAPASVTRVVPSEEASKDTMLAALKQQAVSWIDTMLRKLQKRAGPTANRSVPSLLLLLESDAAVLRCTRYLISSREDFAQSEFDRFVVSYHLMHGGVRRRSSTAEAGGCKEKGHRSAAPQQKGTLLEDDEKAEDDEAEAGPLLPDGGDLNEWDNIAGVDEVLMTQSATACASQIVDGTTHQALLSLPTPVCVDDSEWIWMTQSGVRHGVSRGGITFRCNGIATGATTLVAARVCPDSSTACQAEGIRHPSTAETVTVRLINAKRLTAQQLAQLFVGGRWGGGDRGESKEVASPPFGRLLLSDASLRTLRLVESACDLIASVAAGVTSHTSPSTQAAGIDAAATTEPYQHAQHDSSSLKVVCLSTSFADQNRRRDQKEDELHVARIAILKSTFVERMFCRRDALEEVEQEMLRGRVRARASDAAFLDGLASPAEFNAAKDGSCNASNNVMRMMLPSMKRRRQQPGDSTKEDSRSARLPAPVAATPAARRRMLIVFDEREFRCPLPYQLYASGFDVIPLTLLHGDYVIAKSMALERKSVPDLLQSLWSGRLGNQLQSLCRQFQQAILLIEFSWAGPFRLLRRDRAQSSSTSLGGPQSYVMQVYRRLSMLLKENSSVRVMWSRCAQHTATMCKGIRRQATLTVATEDPDPSEPALTERKEGEAAADTQYAIRILRAFPGIDRENESRVMDAVGSLVGLASASLQCLEEAMGPEKAKRLHLFLHTPLVEVL